jgi:hypothetical protein
MPTGVMRGEPDGSDDPACFRDSGTMIPEAGLAGTND